MVKGGVVVVKGSVERIASFDGGHRRGLKGERGSFVVKLSCKSANGWKEEEVWSLILKLKSPLDIAILTLKS